MKSIWITLIFLVKQCAAPEGVRWVIASCKWECVTI